MEAGDGRAAIAMICPHCEYDLRGATAGRPCPECGAATEDLLAVTRAWTSYRPTTLGTIGAGVLGSYLAWRAWGAWSRSPGVDTELIFYGVVATLCAIKLVTDLRCAVLRRAGRAEVRLAAALDALRVFGDETRTLPWRDVAVDRAEPDAHGVLLQLVSRRRGLKKTYTYFIETDPEEAERFAALVAARIDAAQRDDDEAPPRGFGAGVSPDDRRRA